MVEVEIYAAGLRAAHKLLGLDLELGALPGLRYKVDVLHDIIFIESDNAELSLEELGCIFLKLGLKPRFIGETHYLARTASSTQVIRP